MRPVSLDLRVLLALALPLVTAGCLPGDADEPADITAAPAKTWTFAAEDMAVLKHGGGLGAGADDPAAPVIDRFPPQVSIAAGQDLRLPLGFTEPVRVRALRVAVEGQDGHTELRWETPRARFGVPLWLEAPISRPGETGCFKVQIEDAQGRLSGPARSCLSTATPDSPQMTVALISADGAPLADLPVLFHDRFGRNLLASVRTDIYGLATFDTRGRDRVSYSVSWESTSRSGRLRYRTLETVVDTVAEYQDFFTRPVRLRECAEPITVSLRVEDLPPEAAFVHVSPWNVHMGVPEGQSYTGADWEVCNPMRPQPLLATVHANPNSELLAYTVWPAAPTESGSYTIRANRTPKTISSEVVASSLQPSDSASFGVHAIRGAFEIGISTPLANRQDAAGDQYALASSYPADRYQMFTSYSDGVHNWSRREATAALPEHWTGTLPESRFLFLHTEARRAEWSLDAREDLDVVSLGVTTTLADGVFAGWSVRMPAGTTTFELPDVGSEFPEWAGADLLDRDDVYAGMSAVDYGPYSDIDALRRAMRRAGGRYPLTLQESLVQRVSQVVVRDAPSSP